jgi:transposase
LKRRKYSQEFREEAIKMVIEEGHSAAAVERNLGMGAGLLGRWIRQHKESAADSQGELLAEIRALRKENKRLRQEREILKKAAAFFAKETT